jgi:hypothetical protein
LFSNEEFICEAIRKNNSERIGVWANRTAHNRRIDIRE